MRKMFGKDLTPVKQREKFSEEQLLQLGSQTAFENYRVRLNRVFDAGSDEQYKPQMNAD